MRIQLKWCCELKCVCPPSNLKKKKKICEP